MIKLLQVDTLILPWLCILFLLGSTHLRRNICLNWLSKIPRHHLFKNQTLISCKCSQIWPATPTKEIINSNNKLKIRIWVAVPSFHLHEIIVPLRLSSILKHSTIKHNNHYLKTLQKMCLTLSQNKIYLALMRLKKIDDIFQVS